MEPKYEKLLKLMEEEEFYPLDFLYCICANLVDDKQEEFKTGLSIGGKFFEVSIKKKGIM